MIKEKKEKFLQLKSYEEFDARREEFKGMKIDDDIRKHMGKIFPEAFAPSERHTDVFK